MITLRKGDCLELLKDIPDKSIDLIVTDPPYEFVSTSGGGSQGHKVAAVMKECEDIDIIRGFNKQVLDECYRVMKKPNIYLWCNARQIPMYLDFFVKERGCTFDVLVWIKDNPVPTYSNKYLTDKEYCLYFRKGGYCAPKSYEAARSWWMRPVNAKQNLVSTFLINPQYGWPMYKTDRPSPTIIARQDKRPMYAVFTKNGPSYLEISEGDSETMKAMKTFCLENGIADIKMRMLRIDELLPIMGFPKDYALLGTKSENKKYIGNAVECGMARQLCEALYAACTI